MSEENNTENLTKTIARVFTSMEIIERYNFDEAATKQFVILPILRALGWDDENLDTLEIFPESRTDSENHKRTKVDYALQHEDRVLVFIECKRWSENLEKLKHQEQLAHYIFQRGVDLGVLTNGKTWHFYFAYKTYVPWQRRKFCTIELGNEVEIVTGFQKYLSKSRVLDGSAKVDAEKIIVAHVDSQILDIKVSPIEDQETRRISD